MEIQRLLPRLVWLIGLVCLLPAGSRAQPVTPAAARPAKQVANAARLIEQARAYLYVREATGRNDGPEIDRWNKALGIPLGSFWCGSFQAGVSRDCKLPYPPAAGGARYWFAPASARTYYIRGLRGSADSIRPGDRVGFYYSNLGRIGHIAMVVAPTRAVRSGRPARGWTTIEGNTGTGGGRNGAGVHLLTRASSEFYAAANWSY